MTSSARRDVVVLGSGAAGLVAALSAAHEGARIRLFEKADRIGGTTAVSGGACWVPANRHAPEDDPDSADSALAYLRSLSMGIIRDGFAETLVSDGPETFAWLEAETELRMRLVAGYPDYHPERPGGRPDGGRTLEPELYSYRRLGEWSERIVAGHRNRHLMLSDTTLGGGTGWLTDEEQAHREAEDLRGCGGGLVGPLVKACLDAGVRLNSGCAARELIVDGGRVTGVDVVASEGAQRVLADAVVLATGGFEWDPHLVKAFLRGPMTSPASLPTCTGDGLRMVMRAGAGLYNMPQAWWAPMVEIPGDEVMGRQHSTLLNRERTLPRSIMVNRSGRRFTNEASSYNALGGAFHALDAITFDYVNLPAWLIFDASYLERYGFRGVRPGGVAPDWISRAESVEELGKAIGVPGGALAHTVRRWNTQVSDGADPDFERGASAYDRWSGDADARGEPASTLGPIDTAPYYAVEVRSGTLGTCGGADTDVDGRVLDTSGQPIGGLFAAGNVMAAPTGMAYGGAGGTLGPIITFARRAGRAAAG